MKKNSVFNHAAGLFGSILEHHDKALLVLIAPWISQHYFPAEDLANSLVEMYGMIVLSLLVRPLSAFFIGQIADRYGRKASLIISLLGMSLATLGIGLLPFYHEWGILAPLLLFILRCGQNFFGSGELYGGAVYLLEHTSDRYKPFVASLFESSVMLGILLASLETTILAYFGILESHWQILFIIAGCLGLLGLSLRSKAEETPEFISNQKSLTWKEIWQAKEALLAIIITTGFSYGTYILSITFVNAYIQVLSPLDTWEMTGINTLLIIIDMCVLPIFGWLTFYISPGYMMRFASFSLGILVIPLFAWMISVKTFFAILLVRMVIVILGVCFAAPYRAWIQGLVSVERRCTLLNIGGTIGQLISEGPLTLLSLFFLTQQIALMPAVLMAVLSLSAFGVIYRQHRHLTTFSSLNS